MKKCKQCGTEIDDASRFCPNCGAEQKTGFLSGKKKPLLIGLCVLVICGGLGGFFYHQEQQKRELADRREQLSVFTKKAASAKEALKDLMDEKDPNFPKKELSKDTISKQETAIKVQDQKLQKLSQADFSTKEKQTYQKTKDEFHQLKDSYNKLNKHSAVITEINALFTEPAVTGSEIADDPLTKPETTAASVTKLAGAIKETAPDLSTKLLPLTTLAEKQVAKYTEINTFLSKIGNSSELKADASEADLQAFLKAVGDVEYAKLKASYQGTCDKVKTRLAELKPAIEKISRTELAQRVAAAFAKYGGGTSLQDISELGQVDLNNTEFYPESGVNVTWKTPLWSRDTDPDKDHPSQAQILMKLQDNGDFQVSSPQAGFGNITTHNLFSDISDSDWQAVRSTIQELQIPQLSIDQFKNFIATEKNFNSYEKEAINVNSTSGDYLNFDIKMTSRTYALQTATGLVLVRASKDGGPAKMHIDPELSSKLWRQY